MSFKTLFDYDRDVLNKSFERQDYVRSARS